MNLKHLNYSLFYRTEWQAEAQDGYNSTLPLVFMLATKYLSQSQICTRLYYACKPESMVLSAYETRTASLF